MRRYHSHYDRQAAMWPVPSNCLTVPTSFGTTFVRISGDDALPSLVLLPGMGANSLMWMSMIEGLSRHFRTFAIDSIYDNGKSVWLSPIRNADGFCRWIDQLLDGLGLGDDVRMIGASYGAWIAAEYALRHPNRLCKLVLMAPAGVVRPLGAGFVCHAIPSMLPLRGLTRRFIGWLMADLAGREGEGASILEAIVDDVMLARECFVSRRPVPPRVLSDNDLRKLNVPTMFLVGENEKLFSVHKAVKRLELAAPGIKTRILPGCGHDLFVVEAAAAVRATVDFLV
jgi:pimeloyl-ACP methyl ester carboxylesterase